jgi:hypothetical protein
LSGSIVWLFVDFLETIETLSVSQFLLIRSLSNCVSSFSITWEYWSQIADWKHTLLIPLSLFNSFQPFAFALISKLLYRSDKDSRTIVVVLNEIKSRPIGKNILAYAVAVKVHEQEEQA